MSKVELCPLNGTTNSDIKDLTVFLKYIKCVKQQKCAVGKDSVMLKTLTVCKRKKKEIQMIPASLGIQSNQTRFLFHVWYRARHLSKVHICHEPCHPCKTLGLCFLPWETVRFLSEELNSGRREKKSS